MAQMRLFEIEVGATYWMVARSVRHAMDLCWVQWEQEGALEDVDGGGSLTLTEVPRERAEKLNFRDDEDGSTRSMWEEFRRHVDGHRDPGILACSEW